MSKTLYKRTFKIAGRVYEFEIELGQAFVIGIVWGKPDFAFILGPVAFLVERNLYKEAQTALVGDSCCPVIKPARSFDDL